MARGEAKIRALNSEHKMVDVQYTCPWCGVLARGPAEVKFTRATTREHQHYVLIACQAAECRKGFMAVAHDEYNNLFKVNVTCECTVYPAAESDYGPKGVPPQIAEEFRQALDCASHGYYLGAALVARRVLQAAARDVLKGKRNNLEDEIDAIPDDRLNKALKDQAHQVRFVGNDAAHVDDVLGEEVDDLLGFTEQVLDALYIGPEKLRQLQAARDARKQAAKAVKQAAKPPVGK